MRPTFIEVPGGFVGSGRCTYSDTLYKTARVSKEELDKYQSGVSVYKSFPNLSQADKHFLICGVSPASQELAEYTYQKLHTEAQYNASCLL